MSEDNKNPIVTIDFNDLSWKSDKEISAATLRGFLHQFIEMTMYGDLLEDVDKHYMRKLGIKQ